MTQGLVWAARTPSGGSTNPFRTCAWRLLRRTVRRSLYREALWHGNRESFRMSFASRDSILLWLLRTFRRRRRACEAAMRDPAHARLAFVRLHSPRQTESWMAGIPHASAGSRA